jgi:hypothetical protein
MRIKTHKNLKMGKNIDNATKQIRIDYTILVVFYLTNLGLCRS